MATSNSGHSAEDGTPAAGPNQSQSPEEDTPPQDLDVPPLSPTGTQYVVFDRETGRIVGTYGVLEAGTGVYREQSEDEIRELFAGSTPGAAELDTAPALGVLGIDVQQGAIGVSMPELRVDPSEGQLVPRPRIQLSADRDSITGDGEDSAHITIRVTDAEGVPDQAFSGEVRVSTTHGRLSEPGGRVTLGDGAATITLTSTPETIDRVLVTARDTRQLAVTGTLRLEFL
jgi:hypothetical protein